MADDDLSSKTCFVYDNGLFVELAVRLARDFGKVYYYHPFKSAFPRLRDASVGEGLLGVERVYDLWDVADQVDLWVFPDVYDGDLQSFLRNRGDRVWGSGDAQFLELDRWKTRKLQQELGVPGPPTQKVVGVEALRKHLANRTNKWIKVSYFRGDGETWHHHTAFVSEVYLDELVKRYGPLGHQVEFIVEDNVEGVEIGYDGWTIDGEFPESSLFGIEVKDLGYIGRVLPYSKLPRQIRDVNRAFSPILKEGRCRSFVSFEMRVGPAGDPVMIDPCMRCGSPPTEIWMEMFENLSQVIWEGAAGNMVVPEPIAEWACIAMIHSPWAVHNWTPIAIPNEVRKWVKLRNLTRVDGRDYFVPQPGIELPEIGAVVGLGNSMKEAIAHLDSVAKQVDGYNITIHKDALEKAQESIKEAEKVGIKFK